MWGAIGRVWVVVWLGGLTISAAQLPPDVMVDKYLLEAKMLSEEKDRKGALEAMDRIVALQKEHDLTLPEAFPFHYAQTALAAGSVQAAIDSANRYLSAAGREGKYYRQALELLVKAERGPTEPAPDPVGTVTAKPDIGQRSQEVSPAAPVSDWATKVQAPPDCRQWNTKRYFRTASVEGVTACLAAGADPMARTKTKNTPLHFAARYNENPAVIETLLKAGAVLEARDKEKLTPLHRAAWSNENPAVIETLLKAGADARSVKWTPLHRAAMFSKDPAEINTLVKAGANLEARDKWKYTPLHRAARNNENPAVIETLLKAGAVLEARDKWKLTPLHRAARNNENPAVIETLLKAGADLKAQTKDKWTPLHLAASRNENPAVIETLIKAGADLKARDKWKQTPPASGGLVQRESGGHRDFAQGWGRPEGAG